MNSLQELNGWGQTSITYDDDRTQNVSISAENKLVALNSTTQTFTLPVGITINSASSVDFSSTYDVDVGATGATVNWSTLPTSDFNDSVPSPGLYRITGPHLPYYWNNFNNPTITYPIGYTTENTIEVTLNYPGTGGDSATSNVSVYWPMTNTFSYSTTTTDNMANGFNVTMPVEAFSNTTVNTSNVSVSVGTLSSGNLATITSSTVSQNGNDAQINIQGNIPWQDWDEVTSIPVTVTYDGVTENKSILLHAEYLSITGSPYTYPDSGGANFDVYHITVGHYASGVDAAYQTSIDIEGVWSNLVGYQAKILVADGHLTYAQVTALSDGGKGGSLGSSSYQKIYDNNTGTSSSPVIISTADANWGSIQRPPALINHEFTVAVSWGTGNPQPQGNVKIILDNVPEIASITEKTFTLYPI